MSISLPNGTILAAPSQPQLSAAVTRILHLSNFSAELKTRDLQLIFKEWESEKGGFRIKWLDDVNALVVFADASVAKRAYLSLLVNPPPTFSPPAMIRPYDRPDAAQIIQSLAARSMGHRASMSNAMNGSISTFPFPSNNDPAAPQVHSRAMSVTNSIGKTHGASGSISGIAGLPGHSRGVTAPQRIGGGGSISIPSSGSFGMHQRNGSASSSWGRPSASGGASFGVLSFNNAPRTRLPTHSESLPIHSESSAASRSASSSSGGDPVLLVDNSAGWKGARRESVSAEKALQNVQKALASVEAQG